MARYNGIMESKREQQQQQKKPRGRPAGTRKVAVRMTIHLAADCETIAAGLAGRYGSRVAAIEALIRMAHQRIEQA